jgi:hypothetical protein
MSDADSAGIPARLVVGEYHCRGHAMSQRLAFVWEEEQEIANSGF